MLKAGFARLDITPPFGNPLAGYFHMRFMQGILDPLELNAVAVSNGDATAVFIAVDFIGICMKNIAKLKQLITERTGVPEECIFIASLHQHTSCSLSDTDPNRTHDETYLDVLRRKFADVAQLAIADLKEAELSVAAEDVAEPIAFVRRYFTADGSVATNPSSKLTLTGRCAEADNTMRLVRFARSDAKDIAIVNFSTHPDVIGGDFCSADWPGFTRRFVEADNADVSCLFFTGCQGDSNHYDFFKPKDQRLKGERYEHSRYMGRTVADAVKVCWDKTKPVAGEDIFGGMVVVYNRTNTDGIERYDEMKAWYDDYEAGKLEPTPHITELAYARRIIRLRTSPIFRPVPVTAIQIGNLAFVGFGGEAFTAYGQLVRDIAPDKFVVCAVCANGYEGYLPTEEAFQQGGYEAKSSLFTPCLQQELVDAAKELLHR